MKLGSVEKAFIGFVIFIMGIFMLIQFGLNFADFKTYVSFIVFLFGAYIMFRSFG